MPVAPENQVGRYQDAATLSCWWLSNKDGACQTEPRTDPEVVFHNGQAQETCRDLGHTAMGLGSIINAAETAWIQGDGLYGEQEERILTGVLYAVQVSLGFAGNGWPEGFCNGTTGHSTSVVMNDLAADVVYNHFAIRKGADVSSIDVPGQSMHFPNDDPLAMFIARQRTSSNPVNVISSWESLTHHRISDEVVRPTIGVDRRDCLAAASGSADVVIR